MSKKIFLGFFVTFLGLLFILNVIGKDSHFSAHENRILTQRPAFTWSSFASGQFTTKFEKYISDQFPFKNAWVGMKTKIEKTIGKKENNDVIFGADGYLFERFTRQDNDRLQQNIDILNAFAEGNQTYLLLAPTAVGIYPEKLPRYVNSVSQQNLLREIKENVSSNVQLIDVFQTLIGNKDEALYFKTDHHWTMRGAYYAYVETAKHMGLNPLPIEAFTIEIASTLFQGTLYSKSMNYDMKPDVIELFIPKNPSKFEVEIDGEETDSLFSREFLEEKDQYSVFLGGNHRLVKIKSEQSTGRKLLVIKDSYAHAFVPFLANHYDEIHMLDLRYFKQDVEKYMADAGIDEALFLYNLPNFTVDTNLSILKY